MRIRDLPSTEKIIQNFNRAIAAYILQAAKDAEEKRTTGLFSSLKVKMTPDNGYWTSSVNSLQSFLAKAQVMQDPPVYVILKAHALVMSADADDFRAAMLKTMQETLGAVQSKYGACFMGYRPLNTVIESLQEQCSAESLAKAMKLR